MDLQKQQTSLSGVREGEGNGEKKPQETRPAPIQAKEGGLLVGNTLEEQYRLAACYCKAGFLPQQFNTPEKILTAFQFCFELGLKPLTAMRQIAIINGTPSAWGDLPLALVQQSRKLKSLKEILFDADGNEICRENKNLKAEVFGAECTAIRIDGDRETVRTSVFTVEDAKFAKIWGRNVWATYPKRMLQMRARSQCLKDLFPDALMGIAIAEYDFNTIPGMPGDETDKQPITSKAEQLSTLLKEEKQVVAEVVKTEVKIPEVEIIKPEVEPELQLGFSN